MKWTKSIIGEIGFVDTKNKLCYKEAIKKIPTNARIMKGWECMKIIDEDFKAFKKIPKYEFYFTYGTKCFYRACRLSGFDVNSFFGAFDRGVGSSDDALRGVLVVKKMRDE